MPHVYFITVVYSVNELVIYTMITEGWSKYEIEILVTITWWAGVAQTLSPPLPCRYV